MASILSNNPLPEPQTSDPANSVKNIVDKIMNSMNPQQTFQQVLGNTKEGQDAMNLIRQYGNGDPRQAFLNYASAMGKQSLGQQIMQKLGLM